MIAQLRGSLVQTGDQQTILDVHGVGYACMCRAARKASLEQWAAR